MQMFFEAMWQKTEVSVQKGPHVQRQRWVEQISILISEVGFQLWSGQTKTKKKLSAGQWKHQWNSSSTWRQVLLLSPFLLYYDAAGDIFVPWDGLIVYLVRQPVWVCRTWWETEEDPLSAVSTLIRLRIICNSNKKDIWTENIKLYEPNMDLKVPTYQLFNFNCLLWVFFVFVFFKIVLKIIIKSKLCLMSKVHWYRLLLEMVIQSMTTSGAFILCKYFLYTYFKCFFF